MGPILILCPLYEETKALKASFEAFGFSSQEKPVGHLKAYEFSEQNLWLAQGGHGKTQFGIQSQFFIDRLSPKLLICCGIGGALDPKLKALDIVVGLETVEHDFRLLFAHRPLPKFLGHPDPISRLKKLPSQDFQVHFAPIASGDEDVMSKERAQDIHQRTQAVITAWEGAGGARAAAFNKLSFLEIRAVTDFADAEALGHAEKHLDQAMKNAAVVVKNLVQSR